MKRKLNYLKWWDILILTIIMFGYFIYNSTIGYFSQNTVTDAFEFASSSNWQALLFQLVLLLIAFLYLSIRGFNFSNWTIKFSFKSIVYGILIFIGVALIFDLYFTIISYIYYPNVDNSVYYSSSTNQLLEKLKSIDFSLITYSILNGFYEEIFFLAICLSVNPKNRIYYFIYTLIIRFSFHTYQGSFNALAIGFIAGSIYYILYTKSKDKNLVPFFIAHTITDILGAGIISYLF